MVKNDTSDSAIDSAFTQQIKIWQNETARFLLIIQKAHSLILHEE